MIVARKPLKIRTAEYDRMADAGVFDSDRRRMELLGGQLYEMPPIGTPHLIVVTRLQRLFERALEEDLRVLVQQPLVVDQFDEPQPDLVILRQPLQNRKPQSRDCLVVIEVSDTSYDDDRNVKLPAYLHGGVPLVWIVNIRHSVLEEYDRLPGPDELGARRYYPGETMPSVEDVTVDVGALLSNLPIDDR
jgi:Uma2 family endonuclease